MALSAAAWGTWLADPEREDTFYAVILADKQEFVNAELTGAGHCTVHTACIDALPARLAESRERTLQEATVPSLRADAVLAAMLHTSRTRAAEYIAAGRVEINHLPLKAAHETAYAADIFTVRGVGRFKLAAIGGKSRKDRLFYPFTNIERRIARSAAAGNNGAVCPAYRRKAVMTPSEDVRHVSI